jgi:hypothetical protein
MIGFSYAQLVTAMQDWPVNAGTNYVGNIPRFVELGELRLVRDLNLEFFDETDSSFVLLAGKNIVNKPAAIVTLRTMRLAAITGTTSLAASPNSLCLTQASTVNETPLVFNGALSPAPSTLFPAAQVTATEVANSVGGIVVTVVGLDQNGHAVTESVTTLSGGLAIATENRFSLVIQVSTESGATPRTLEVGNAAVAQSTLGKSFALYKRNWDYLNNFASDPAVTAPPRYYAEVDEFTWQVAQAADINYAVLVRYIKRPESIVTAGNTWLGDRCGDLLFQCSLLEAENYLKADDRFADIQNDYASKLQTARIELRNSIRQGDYSPAKGTATTVQG